ncbi:hypothetical protein BC567DRAFT_251448 [Phyllosticta citribraziliensis]
MSIFIKRASRQSPLIECDTSFIVPRPDLSAARETDLLFAKKGHDLIKFCVREDIPFTVFESWKDIHAVCKEIVEGKKSVQEAAVEGHQQFKSGEAGVNGSANGAAK